MLPQSLQAQDDKGNRKACATREASTAPAVDQALCRPPSGTNRVREATGRSSAVSGQEASSTPEESRMRLQSSQAQDDGGNRRTCATREASTAPAVDQALCRPTSGTNHVREATGRSSTASGQEAPSTPQENRMRPQSLQAQDERGNRKIRATRESPTAPAVDQADPSTASRRQSPSPPRSGDELSCGEQRLGEGATHKRTSASEELLVSPSTTDALRGPLPQAQPSDALGEIRTGESLSGMLASGDRGGSQPESTNRKRWRLPCAIDPQPNSQAQSPAASIQDSGPSLLRDQSRFGVGSHGVGSNCCQNRPGEKSDGPQNAVGSQLESEVQSPATAIQGLRSTRRTGGSRWSLRTYSAGDSCNRGRDVNEELRAPPRAVDSQRESEVASEQESCATWTGYSRWGLRSHGDACSRIITDSCGRLCPTPSTGSSKLEAGVLSPALLGRRSCPRTRRVRARWGAPANGNPSPTNSTATWSAIRADESQELAPATDEGHAAAKRYCVFTPDRGEQLAAEKGEMLAQPSKACASSGGEEASCTSHAASDGLAASTADPPLEVHDEDDKDGPASCGVEPSREGLAPGGGASGFGAAESLSTSASSGGRGAAYLVALPQLLRLECENAELHARLEEARQRLAELQDEKQCCFDERVYELVNAACAGRALGSGHAATIECLVTSTMASRSSPPLSPGPWCPHAPPGGGIAQNSWPRGGGAGAAATAEVTSTTVSSSSHPSSPGPGCPHAPPGGGTAQNSWPREGKAGAAATTEAPLCVGDELQALRRMLREAESRTESLEQDILRLQQHAAGAAAADDGCLAAQRRVWEWLLTTLRRAWS